MSNTNQIQTAARVQRFSFASFDAEEAPVQAVETAAVEEVKAVEPLPTLQERVIKEEELHRAKNEGHEQGYKEGFAAAEAKFNKEESKREEDIKAVLETMANRITIAAAEHATYLAGRQDVMNKAVMTIARKVAGEAIKAEPYAGVEAMLRESVALIAGEQKIKVTVPAGLGVGLKQRVDTMRPLLTGFSGQIIVEENADMKDNDCRVEWSNGYAESEAAKLWNEIETIISRTRT